MPQYNFGSGNVFGVRTDINNPTPVQLGVVQDVSVDFSFSMKELMGQNSFPVDVARAAGKITGKAKAAQLSANTFNNFFFGQAVTAGTAIAVASGETLAGGTPATVSNAATFIGDLGLKYSSTGNLLTRVASSPTVGEYAVSTAGVYTLNSTDSTVGLSASYEYAGATGNEIVVANTPMGVSPTFRLVLSQAYEGNVLVLVLNQCKSSKFTLDFKNEDFTIPEFDFSAFADASGNVCSISMTAA